jgi:dimeric dUTPase (all-alpha-NTP-PPase superfamily)
MKTEEAKFQYCDKISSTIFKTDIVEQNMNAFDAGAQFITERAYNKERMQRLFSHICEIAGHSLLENDMHEIIHILTADEYEQSNSAV